MRLHLDRHATTPLRPSVREAMAPWWSPSGPTAAADALERARDEVRRRIGAPDHRVVFTSGATESNNLAIAGVARGRHVVTVATEHVSVLGPVGASGTPVPVDASGRVDPDALRRAIRPDTALVSVMAVNNEIGVIADLAAIGATCREAGVPLHTDAAQIPFTTIDASWGLDLVTLSAHKLGGPQGIGALVVGPDVELEPLLRGGPQQDGLRAGPVPVALAVGLGAAMRPAGRGEEVAALRDRLAERLENALPGMRWNGHRLRRAPHNLNVVLPGVDTAMLVALLAEEIVVSTGSACHAGNPAPSHVLEAIGVRGRDLGSVLRVGLGHDTTAADVDLAAERIVAAARIAS